MYSALIPAAYTIHESACLSGCSHAHTVYLRFNHSLVLTQWAAVGLGPMAFNLADMSRSCIISCGGRKGRTCREGTQTLYMQILGPGLSGLTSVPVTTEGARKQRE